MLQRISKSICAIAFLATGGVAEATEGDNLDLRVTGKVIPAACTPTISLEGVFDYGTITSEMLAVSGFTPLDTKSLDFSIACGGKVKVALRVTSQQEGNAVGHNGMKTIATAPVDIFETSSVRSMGLGMSGESGIGGVGIRIVPDKATIDSEDVSLIESLDGGATWISSPIGSLVADEGQTLYLSWTKRGSTPLAPYSFADFSGKIEVHAYLNKKSELDLSKAIKMEGRATIEAVYL